MKKYITLAFVLSAALLSTAQDATQLLPERYNDYALNYYLPKTVAEIEFVATKTTCKAGPYYEYAQKYLGTTDVITQDIDIWNLERASIISRGVANTDNRFQLTFKPGQLPYIFVDSEGTILSINTHPNAFTPDSFPIVAPDIINNIDMNSALSGEILMAGSTAKMAEVAAKQIYYIRECRMDLLTGNADNVPADGEALKIIIDRLDQQEAALTALFVGTRQVSHVTKIVKYAPQEDISNEVILRFSDQLGFVDANDLSGAPIYLNINITQQGEYPVDNKGVEKRVPKGAIAYNIPGKAMITIAYDNQTIAEKELQVAQLGVIFGIDPNLLTTKKSPTFVVFNPTTGGIAEIGVISEEETSINE